jgi:predicted ester cyclase
MPHPNRDLVNRMIQEIQNQKNVALVDELFSEDFINHTPVRGISTDRNGMRQLFSMTHIAFPDGALIVEDQASSADKVWTRKTFSGTHTGPLANTAPTGNKVAYTVFDILTIRDGRIVEHWGLADRLSLLGQLGVLKL